MKSQFHYATRLRAKGGPSVLGDNILVCEFDNGLTLHYPEGALATPIFYTDYMITVIVEEAQP